MKNLKRNRQLAFDATIWMCCLWVPALYGQATYPRDIIAKDGTITLYQRRRHETEF